MPVTGDFCVIIGCTKAEALALLKEVLQYYVAYTMNPDERKRYTPESAYAKCVRRWPDSMFDAYTYPKVTVYSQPLVSSLIFFCPF